MSTLPISVTHTTLAGHTRDSVIGPSVAIGFFAATFLWSAWFITHLPWLGLSQQVALPIMLGVWLGAFVFGGTYVRHSRAIVGAIAGAVSAALGLLILFSMLSGKDPSGAPRQWPEHLPLIVGGFLCTGLISGLVGVVGGGVFARANIDSSSEAWLGRFAKVVVLVAAPLLFVGGLVTSTQSGMAVPDWPSSFGMNMFLYPLGTGVNPSIFLEHSHRLFGTLLGVASMVLAGWAAWKAPTPFAKGLGIALFVLVVLQGLVGARRVLDNDRLLAMLHGVSAQLVFAGLVTFAVHVSPGFRIARHTPVTGARRAKAITTSTMHALILQLVLGAAYRHFRHDHILYSHALFAFLVTFGGFMAAAVVWGLRDTRTNAPLPSSGLLPRAALAVAGSIVLQFLLGWFAFGFAGKQAQASGPLQALIRTVHQANGAVVLGAVTVLFVAVRGAFRASRNGAAG